MIKEYGKKLSNNEFIKKIIILLLLFICLFSNSNVMAQSNIISLINVKVHDKSDTTIVNDVNYDNLSISSDVTFHNVNDYVTYEITLKNNTRKNYILKSLTTTSNNDYVIYSCTNCSALNVPKEGEIKVLLTSKYMTQVQNINERTQNNEFDLQLKLIDENGNLVNPQTGDNINLYIYMAVVSFIILFTMFASSNKNNRKKKVQITSILILIFFALPTMASAVTDSINIKFQSKIQLFDRVVLTTVEDGKEKQTFVGYGEEVALPTKHEEKLGYEFVGWTNENGDLINKSQIATKDISYLPKYKIIEYVITVNLNGGNANVPTIYTVESNDFTLPEPKKDGFTFIGWTGSNGDTPQKEIIITKGSTGNVTYTANWEIIRSGPTMEEPNENDTHKGIAYLNPTDLTVYCDATNSINTEEVEIGCKRFYIFDDSGDTYKMILDRNTTPYVAWNSDEENSNSEMKEVLEALENDTKGWIGNPRLITADEVASAIGSTIWSSNTATQTDRMFFGSRDKTNYSNQTDNQKEVQRKYHWLFDYTKDCTDYGCMIEDSSTKGYWTSTPLANDEYYSWMVSRTGLLGNNDATIDDIHGVRPVITLLKTTFSS